MIRAAAAIVFVHVNKSSRLRAGGAPASRARRDFGAWSMVSAISAVSALMVVHGAAAPGATVPPDVRAVLSRDLKFSSTDFTDLERGRIVKHTLDATAPGEVAVAAATRVGVRKEQFIERLRDIAQFKRGPDVVQIGRFGNPPALEDLAPLQIGREDIDLRNCRVGNCDIRLPRNVIERFQRDIDWNAPDADARAATLFRQVLLDNVRAYEADAPGRILEYDDEKRPVRPVDDFDGLLRASKYVGALVPEMPAHLLNPSSAPMANAEDFVYWSKEKFGLTPFITVTHVTICPIRSGAYVIASRDVYSTRYVDASLSFTIASDVAGAEGACYLVYANRSRAYALKGPFAGLRRSIVERRTRNSVEENLRNMKMKLEGAR